MFYIPNSQFQNCILWSKEILKFLRSIWNSEDQICIVKYRKNSFYKSTNFKMFFKEYLSFRNIWNFQPTPYWDLMLIISIFSFVEHLHNFLHKWIHQKFRYYVFIFQSFVVFVTFITDFSIVHQDGFASHNIQANASVSLKDSFHWFRFCKSF